MSPATQVQLLAAGAAGLSVWILLGSAGSIGPTALPSRRVRATVSPRLAGLVGGFGVWTLVGGAPGLLLAVVVAIVVPIGLGKLEPASVRTRRLALVRDSPLVADLLAAALHSGVPLAAALPVVAGAFSGPTGVVLTELARRFELGMDGSQGWALIADEPGLGPIARAASRSARTGAPLAELLITVAEELRLQATAAGLEQIRAAGVRAVLPLGLCLLPAFVLLGVVPVVAGLVPNLL